MSMERRLNRLGIDPDLPEDEIVRRVELLWAGALVEMEAATRKWEQLHPRSSIGSADVSNTESNAETS